MGTAGGEGLPSSLSATVATDQSEGFGNYAPSYALVTMHGPRGDLEEYSV